MNQVRIIYRRKRRTFNKKQLEALYRSFDQGRKPPELSNELGRSISTVYRHYKLWNERDRCPELGDEKPKREVEAYVAAIGPDKPSVDWAAVGNALIQLGRAFGGIHPV